jgi:hypothetical protein
VTVTLKIEPELEAELLARAAARGMSLEAYLLSLVKGAVSAKALAAESTEERAAAFESWANDHRPFAPPLSENAVSRESMYDDHER